MIWITLRSSSHLRETVLNTDELNAAYVKYVSFLKSWCKITHFMGGSRETNRDLWPLEQNAVLHNQVQMSILPHLSSSFVRSTWVYFDQRWSERRENLSDHFSLWTLNYVDNSMYAGKKFSLFIIPQIVKLKTVARLWGKKQTCTGGRG